MHVRVTRFGDIHIDHTVTLPLWMSPALFASFARHYVLLATNLAGTPSSLGTALVVSPRLPPYTHSRLHRHAPSSPRRVPTKNASSTTAPLDGVPRTEDGGVIGLTPSEQEALV